MTGVHGPPTAGTGLSSHWSARRESNLHRTVICGLLYR